MEDRLKILYLHGNESIESFRKIDIFFDSLKKEVDCDVIVLLENLINKDNLAVFKNMDDYDSIENYIDLDSKLNDTASTLFLKNYSNINFNYLHLPIGGKNGLYNSGNNFYIYLIKYIDFFHNYIIDKRIDVVLCSLINAYNNFLVPILLNVCITLNIKRFIMDRATYGRLYISENINSVPVGLEETYLVNMKNGLTEDEFKKVKKAMGSFISYVTSSEYKKIMWRL